MVKLMEYQWKNNSDILKSVVGSKLFTIAVFTVTRTRKKIKASTVIRAI